MILFFELPTTRHSQTIHPRILCVRTRLIQLPVQLSLFESGRRQSVLSSELAYVLDACIGEGKGAAK